MPDRTPGTGTLVKSHSGERGETSADHELTLGGIWVRLDSGFEPRHSSVEPATP